MTRDIVFTEDSIQELDFSFFIAQQCNGIERTYFEDQSDNVIDMVLRILNVTELPCVMKLVAEDKKGKKVEIEVPPLAPGSVGVLTVELDNVKKIQFKCEGNGGFCFGLVDAKKTICIQCNETKKNR